MIFYYDKRSSQKWRTLCSCAVGNEKKYASYHIMLTSFKKDIFIGPYISVPNEGTEKWVELNKKYSEIWPNISEKKDSPYGEKLKNEENKFEKYFKENI